MAPDITETQYSYRLPSLFICRRWLKSGWGRCLLWWVGVLGILGIGSLYPWGVGWSVNVSPCRCKIQYHACNPIDIHNTRFDDKEWLRQGYSPPPPLFYNLFDWLTTVKRWWCIIYIYIYNVIHLYVNQSPNLTTPLDFTAVKSSCVEDNFDPHVAYGLPRGLNKGSDENAVCLRKWWNSCCMWCMVHSYLLTSSKCISIVSCVWEFE